MRRGGGLTTVIVPPLIFCLLANCANGDLKATLRSGPIPRVVRTITINALICMRAIAALSQYVCSYFAHEAIC